MSIVFLLFLLICIVLFYFNIVNGQDGVFVGDEIDGDGDTMLVSLLLEAAREGDIDGIREELAKGANIDTTNVNGWSAAAFAVAAGKLGVLEVLIQEGIDLNQANDEGMTPLMLASLQGDKEMVELMIQNNADPTIATASGETAFSIAKQSGRALVQLLIAESCVIHGMNRDDDALVIEYIKNGAYVNIPSASGWTPIIHASYLGNESAVEELIALGASVNQAEYDGWTPLHFAAFNNHFAVVESLVNNGAYVSPQTNDGRTPLAMAEKAGNTMIASYLESKTDNEL